LGASEEASIAWGGCTCHQRLWRPGPDTRTEDAEIDEESVSTFLEAHLASYKVPRRVLFVRRDEHSLTGSAKLRTSALRDLAAQRLAD